MKFSVNNVILTGTLARDPDTRYIPSGACVCKLNLAVVDEYAGKDGAVKQSTLYINAEVWGKAAEQCSERLRMGSEVCVEGSLKSESWEGKDGQKKSQIKVNARNVRFDLSAAPHQPAPRQDPARFPSDDSGPAQAREGIPEETTSDGGDLPF